MQIALGRRQGVIYVALRLSPRLINRPFLQSHAASRYGLWSSPFGPFLESNYANIIVTYILPEFAIMKLAVAFKSLIVATALVGAGVANAVTAPATLPFITPTQIDVQGSTFSNTFAFHVPTLSNFSAHLGSSDSILFGSLSILAINFGSISLSNGTTGIYSNTGTTNTGDISAILGQGNYTLTVTGTASPVTLSGLGAIGSGGSYSIYGNMAPVPEPESYAMFLAGLGVIGAVVSRRRKNI